MHSVWLSSFLGALVREMVPYNLTDWRRVSPTKCDILWALIQVKRKYTIMCVLSSCIFINILFLIFLLLQAKYDLHKDWYKKWCFKVMNDLWRALKSRLVYDLINVRKESEHLALKSNSMKSDAEQKAFVKLKTSKEHQVCTTIFLLHLLI